MHAAGPSLYRSMGPHWLWWLGVGAVPVPLDTCVMGRLHLQKI
jgi:hypothetical protein